MPKKREATRNINVATASMKKRMDNSFFIGFIYLSSVF